MEPILLRIPFSHFCRKVEWGLSHASIPYRSLDVQLWQMKHAHRANPVEGTVPVLFLDDAVLFGSNTILRWADKNRIEGRPALYPTGQEENVLEWESWADDTIAPATRREAYRQLYSDPRPYARNWGQKVAFRLARPMFLNVLKFYKARRFDDMDPEALRRAIDRTAHQLGATPFLFGQEPTAADFATAALFEPLLPIAHVRGYDGESWRRVAQYIDQVRPRKGLRVAKRPVRESQWRWMESRAQAASEGTGGEGKVTPA